MMKAIKIAVYAVPLLVLAAPFIVSAQLTPEAPIKTIGEIENLLNKILNYFYTFFFIAAAFMFIWAAFVYLTAQGAEDKVSKAKNILIYGIIAVVVALVALGIDNIVADVIGGGAVQ